MKEVILTEDFNKRLAAEQNNGWLLTLDTYKRESGLTTESELLEFSAELQYRFLQENGTTIFKGDFKRDRQRDEFI